MIRLALVPVFILGLYIYFRDANREPIWTVLKAFGGGILVVALVLLVHRVLPTYIFDEIPFLRAFISAAGVEECCKFLVLYWLIWKSQDFDEPFDGIVYAAFIGLGFAFLEDLLYIIESSNPLVTGIMRAFTAVPAHFFFGVIMGYNFGLARFVPMAYRVWRLFLAILLPIIFHGLYDYFLMKSESLKNIGDEQTASILMVAFFVFDIILWRVAVRRIRNMRSMTEE